MRTILLTVDALRHDFFVEDYFPDCWPLFSDEFSMFPRAYSHGTATPIAFPGLISGRPISGSGVLPDDSPTLAEFHSGLCIARSNNLHLSPERGYARGFDQFETRGNDAGEVSVRSKIKSFLGRSDLISTAYNRVQGSVSQGSSDPPYTLAGSLSEKIIEDLDSDPDFLWAHYMDPHTPHTQASLPDRDLPNSDDYYEDLSDRFHDENVSESEVDELESLYGKHVRYLDRKLRPVLDELESRDWWDDALVIFVADHGEAFGEEGQLVHPWDDDPIDATTRVPLAVKFPNDPSAERLEHRVRHSDVYREVAAHTDSTVKCSGLRLRDDDCRIIISKSNSSIRAISEDGSLIVRRDGTQVERGDVSTGMRDAVSSPSFPEVSLLSGNTPGCSQSPEVQKQLEALGYK